MPDKITVALSPDGEARGRNGWFGLHEAEVERRSSLLPGTPEIILSVRSRRYVWLAPVRVELSVNDAVALAHALLAVAGSAPP